MTLFFLGFFSAIALLAVTVIFWAVVAYRRQERKRQAEVDAIMAKVVAGEYPKAPPPPTRPERDPGPRLGQLGKKGLH